MSEYDDLLPDEPVARQGPRQVPGPNDELPPLTTAADLLPPEDDPLSSVPVEEPDEETPPDEAAPAFLVMPVAGRPMPSIYTANGTPVGVWIHEEHHELNGGEIFKLLTDMGMEEQYAAWYGKQRDGRIEADRQLAANPVVQAFAEEEDRRKVEKKRVQDAFVDAQRKKK